MDNSHGHHKKLVSFVYGIIRFLPRFVFSTILCMLKNGEGKICVGIRYICVKRLSACCGDNVAIFQNVTLNHIEKMRIGDNVSIHPMCYIDAIGGVEIGNNVSIAHSSSIVSFDHTYSDYSLPIKYNKVKLGKVVIEDDVWIGCGCRILQGVNIKTRCIIAAGAVLTNSTSPNTIFGGIPAKAIKQI